MELKLKFFNNEMWSIHGTINVAIILLLFLITRQQITVQTLIFMSILGMMKGPLLNKIIFTGFMNFLVFRPNVEWIFKSILFIIGILITHQIPEQNKLQLLIKNNIIYLNIFRGVIFVWMVYIMYLIIFPLNKWKK